MVKVVQIIKNKRGSGYIWACVVVMVLTVILSALVQYYSVYRIVNLNREQVRQQLDSYVTEVAIRNFNAFRQGSAYSSRLDETELVQGAYAALSVSGAGGTTTIQRQDETGMLCTMKGVIITRTAGKQVGVKASYTLEIPVQFMGKTFPSANVNLSVSSRLVNIN